MRNMKKAGGLMAAAIATLLAFTATAGAQEGDLDCGDPGTSPNMQVDPNNDPHGLDSDHDGIGCEDDSASGGAPAPATTEAPAPAPADDNVADEGVAQGPAAEDGTSLPRTGSTTTPLAIGGGALVALGAAAFFARRYVYIPRHSRAG